MENLLDHFLTYLVIEKGLSENTIGAYERDIRSYIDHLSSKNVSEIGESSSAHIIDHLERLKQGGLSARTRARHLTSIRVNTMD